MRTLIAVTLMLTVLGGAAQAKDMKSCSADWKTAKAGAATGGQSHLAFMAACMKGGASVSQTVTTKAPGLPAKTVATTSSAPVAIASGTAPARRHSSVQGWLLQHVQAPQRVVLAPWWRGQVPELSFDGAAGWPSLA